MLLSIFLDREVYLGFGQGCIGTVVARDQRNLAVRRKNIQAKRSYCLAFFLLVLWRAPSVVNGQRKAGLFSPQFGVGHRLSFPLSSLRVVLARVRSRHPELQDYWHAYY